MVHDFRVATVDSFNRLGLVRWWQVGMITDGWDINLYFSGCFKYGCAFFNLDLSVVDQEFYRGDGFSLPRVRYCLRFAC